MAGSTAQRVTADRRPRHALTAALLAADAAGGGTVCLPAGTYAISAPLGRHDPPLSRVHLTGVGDRGPFCIRPFAAVAGSWFMFIENLMIDAGARRTRPGGRSGQSYLRHRWVLQLGRLRDLAGTRPARTAQLDRRQLRRTVQGHRAPVSIRPTGSTTPGSSTTTSAPPARTCRWRADRSGSWPTTSTGRHGTTSEMRGNRLLTIVGNICEGARREAIIYTMPAWLDATVQVQIVGNKHQQWR